MAPTHLYGINPVEAALLARRRELRFLFLRQGEPSERLLHLRRLAEAIHLPVAEAPPSQLERQCGSPAHQGAVLDCGPLPVMPENTALGLGAGQDFPLLVALDQVEDPRNLGAVVRACNAFAATAVVVPRHHRAPGSAAASSASAGALESFPLVEVANLARFLAAAAKGGWWVAGAAAEGGTGMEQVSPGQPLVLVLGNEGRGLRPLVARQCHYLLTLPLPGGGSLNVASAAAVLLYALRNL